jgi:hypothetical protein
MLNQKKKRPSVFIPESSKDPDSYLSLVIFMGKWRHEIRQTGFIPIADLGERQGQSRLY